MSRKYHRVRFTLLAAMIFFVIAGAAAVAAVKHLADSSYWLTGAALLSPVVLAGGGKLMRRAQTPSSAQLEEELENLRNLVLHQWLEEIGLRISFYPMPVPFSLAATVTIAADEVRVMDSWAAILGDPDRTPPSIHGTYNSIAAVFRNVRMPSRLVVLGEPASGKSVLAQHLVVSLIKEWQEQSSGAQPSALRRSTMVPVLLPLATWDPTVALKDWAAVQMIRSYPWLGTQMETRGGARRTLAGFLIDQGRVLMVLDGLDEVSPGKQLQAFKKLSEAARKDQAMVVTCRTRDYAEIVRGARQPLARTPVVRLEPLPQEAVCTYLTESDSGSPPRFGRLAERIRSAPHGPLAEAFSSPFALWLVTAVYQDPDTNPNEITGCQSRSEIMRYLREGLVTAVYSAAVNDDLPAPDDPEVIARTRRRLGRIADYLGPEVSDQNIDWWRLPDKVPRLFRGGIIGTLVGCVLGAAVGLAAATRFNDHRGVLLGILFGAVTGVISGVTVARPQEHPRAVDLHFTWDYWRFVACLTVGVIVGLTSGYADHLGGGLIPGLVTAAAVGPVCAVPCIVAFGWQPGITAGITASTALGLSSGLSEGNGHPVWSGLAAGFIFVISAWVFVGIFQPVKDKLVVNPQSLLDRDRAGSLAVGVTAGVAFGVVYGIALGPVFGLVALVALFVSVAATVSTWGTFNASRPWLALTGMFPLRIMTFLHEAHERGVLRQVGGSYQFRHTELKEALLATSQGPEVRRGDAHPPGEDGQQDPHRARAPEAEQLAEAKVTQATVVPLGQADQRTGVLHMVRKTFKNLPAGHVGPAAVQHLRERAAGRRGGLGGTQGPFSAGE
jgi:hypothetical protein